MSANYPPPQQPPAGQNPFAQQPYGPPQPPYGAPAPAGFNGPAYPPPPVAPARDNAGLGIVVGVAVMLVAVFAYAGIMRAMAKDDGTYSEVGYAALGVGLLIGAAMGKAGGRNPVLPIAGLVLSLLGVFLGEIVGLSMIASHYAALGGADISWFTVLTDHFGDVFDQWKHDFDVTSFFFLALAGVEGFVITRRVAR
ncbi:hypothetical protein [Streptomyces sp.]|uniref:hypothetical protein n=1 Tax=Streptomyces sp. TaxID=1931 RepID=UPI002F41835F